jgi:hypothetical protein
MTTQTMNGTTEDGSIQVQWTIDDEFDPAVPP